MARLVTRLDERPVPRFRPFVRRINGSARRKGVGVGVGAASGWVWSSEGRSYNPDTLRVPLREGEDRKGMVPDTLNSTTAFGPKDPFPRRLREDCRRRGEEVGLEVKSI